MQRLFISPLSLAPVTLAYVTLAYVVLASITALTLVEPGHADTPVCQSAESDSNNDGWGWENNSSCRVSDSLASSSESRVTTVTNNSNRPACTTIDADPDGDGWGWELGTSCIATLDTQPVAAEIPSVSASIDGSVQMVLPETDTETDSEPVSVNATTESDAQPIPETTPLYDGRHPICTSQSSDIDSDGWGWEFSRTCKVVEDDVTPQTTLESLLEDNAQNDNTGEIYRQNFNNANVGLYQADQLNEDWQSPHWHLGFDQGRVKIVNTDRFGHAMEVTYPAGRYGTEGSTALLSDIQFSMDLPKSYNELYVSYDIRFAEGFDFVKGGKLPGLCGADNNEAPSTGCNTGGGYPTGYDGWSARGMWREDGVLENYIYHASQRNYYGDDEFWDVSATPGRWHRIQHRVALNTPGKKNGVLEAWLDGKKVLSLNNIEYRKTASIGINLFYFSTFFGGNDASWAPSTDQTINFDNFVISTEKIN